MSTRHSPFSMVVFSLVLAISAFFAFRSFNFMMYGSGAPASLSGLLSFGKKGAESNANVAIFYSEATSKYFGNERNYAALVDTWSGILDKLHIKSRVIRGADLTGDMSGYSILVMPLAVCMSDGEMRAVKNFVSKQGNGLVVTGFAGARDEKGEWRQVSLASEILGGERIEPADLGAVTDGRPVYMILDGLDPLSAGIPPGFRLGVNTYDQPIAATIIEPRTSIAAYWENGGFKLYQTSAEKTALVSGGYMGGRFVWLGFSIGNTLGDSASLEVRGRLINNIMDYAAFMPIFSKELWPGGKQAAVVLAEDTEDKFDNASAVANLFAEKRVPITFFCVPELVERYRDVFKQLYSRPEFELGLHGVELYKGQSLDQQKERLLAGRSLIKKLSGRVITGFRPPEAQYDENTMDALMDADYEYMPGDDILQASPIVHLTRKHQLFSIRKNLRLFIKFPKTGNDDYDILLRDGITDKEKMLEVMKRDFDAVYKIGGLYYFSFHTQLMADPKYLDVISRFIDYVNTKNVWLANFGQAADWWKKRMLVDIDTTPIAQRRMGLRVTNNSTETIDGIKVKIQLPPGITGVKATPDGMSVAAPEISMSGNNTAILNIKTLETDENRGFVVDLTAAGTAK